MKDIIFTSIIFILSIFIVVLLMSRKKDKRQPMGYSGSNFEKDIQYLMFLIDYFCQIGYNTKLIPYQKQNNNNTFINDTIFNDIVLETSNQIMGYVSEEYRHELSYYIPNTSEFVSELVYNRFIEYIMELNTEAIRQINT